MEGKGHATVSRMVLFCCYMVFVIILKLFLYVHQFAGHKRNEKYGLSLVYWQSYVTSIFLVSGQAYIMSTVSSAVLFKILTSNIEEYQAFCSYFGCTSMT